MQTTEKRNLRASISYYLATVVVIFFMSGLVAFAEKEPVEDLNDKSLFDLPLEDVMELEAVSLGSLTMTTRQLNPAATTTITQDQIRLSGAHSLNEVLEIY